MRSLESAFDFERYINWINGQTLSDEQLRGNPSREKREMLQYDEKLPEKHAIESKKQIADLRILQQNLKTKGLLSKIKHIVGESTHKPEKRIRLLEELGSKFNPCTKHRLIVFCAGLTDGRQQVAEHFSNLIYSQFLLSKENRKRPNLNAEHSAASQIFAEDIKIFLKWLRALLQNMRKHADEKSRALNCKLKSDDRERTIVNLIRSIDQKKTKKSSATNGLILAEDKIYDSAVSAPALDNNIVRSSIFGEETRDPYTGTQSDFRTSDGKFSSNCTQENLGEEDHP